MYIVVLFNLALPVHSYSQYRSHRERCHTRHVCWTFTIRHYTPT